MKLIPFTYTNEYDKASQVSINPAFVVSLRPAKSNQTTISLASKAEITVDGSIELVSAQLCGDDQPEETTS